MLIKNYTLLEGEDLNEWQGIYAADGSFNVVDSSEEENFVGVYHPCGAYWVTFTEDPKSKAYAPNGSHYALTVEDDQED